ncbi:hypothetical protein FJW06_15360 [Mesorhizobium sp. B4-1-3]|uniref:hypothetical protein n=1 Tax=Mesorhizobium sp. B4-1-3 TaxID=2589889 RepID=UPI00112AEEE8|nr:hypothetical protein [Mesorhizobium sp. B4-1-3]TPI13033.1 hypothetical protein FJW06_15360 [Mesorhizobium sp. B4-1-3]
MFKQIQTLAVVALALSGCVSDYKKVDGKPFYGTTPAFTAWDQKKKDGLIPVSISCRMPQSGPAAYAPKGTTVSTKWAKAPPNVKWVEFFTGPQSDVEPERVHARSLGARKISGGSFYQTVSKQRIYCEIWRTD